MNRPKLRHVVPLSALIACGTSRGETDLAAAGSAETADGGAGLRPYDFASVQTALGGTIPFPAEKLVDALLALAPDSSVDAAIFPHGRSLERSITDFREPRTLMLWKDTAGVAPYRLFVGYTPNAQELEVIAWSWPKRQFDFLLVQDYADGKTPRVVAPPRELCMACHQSGGPIFAVAPWNESTLNSTIQAQVVAQAEDGLSTYLLHLPSNDTRIRVNPAVLDFQVRESTSALQEQALCANACGGDLECRKGILLAALLDTIDPFSSTSVSPAWRTKMTQAMQRVWPADRFMVVDDAIADRTVDPSAPLRFDSSEDPLLWRSPSYPRTPADATGDLLLAGYANCWRFTADEVETLKGWGAARVEAAMATEQLGAVAATWLPQESTVLSALAEAVTAPPNAPGPPPATVPWSAPADPAPIDHGGRAGDSAAALFADYCSYCHAGPSPRPPVLPLGDVAALGHYVGSAGRTVRALLDPAHPIMPPRGAPQPTADERQQMLSALPP
jgi:hypothetical protein